MIKPLFRLVLAKIPRPWLIRLSYVASPLLAWYYRGKRYQDPIDGRQYRKLLPYGYGDRQRENALAPGSLSLERHRLLWLYLQQQTDFFDAGKTRKMLHIAPEQCFYKRFRKMGNLEYITGDLNSPIADVQMDLHQIPFDDNTFELVFCNHVLEHVQDDRQCMREIYRVLKPGGWAILQVPQDPEKAETDEDPSVTDPKERIRRFGQYDHVRMYGLDYPDRLTEAGFRVDIVDVPGKMDKQSREKYALPEKELLYVGRKAG